MSLQGSIETFALPDVLGLLATTKKNGELRVASDQVEGSVWVSGGQLVQSVVGGRSLAATDAVFELLRLSVGTFSFVAEAVAPAPGQPESVEAVLGTAKAALAEWQEIAKIVPDVNAVVTMVAELSRPEVTVSAPQWKLLVAVGGGRPVSELMSLLDTGEFATGKAVKGLVDAGLATVVAAASPKAKPGAKSLQAVEADTTAPADRAREARAKAVAGVHAVRSPRPGTESADTPAGKDDRSTHARPGWNTPAVAKAAPASDKGRRHPSSPAAGDKSEASTAADAQVLVAQLAALTDDDEDVVAEKVAAHLAEGGELPPVADANEPINRGLLLKFLSSVRS